jgi:hypothetical protein
MIKNIGYYNKIEDVISECKSLLNTVPFLPNMNQLSLQVKSGSAYWYDSFGSLLAKHGNPIIENSYTEIHPDLKGSAIDQWIQSLSVPVYRARLMLVTGRTSYSVHKDMSPRIHLPVITNDQCFMCFPRLGIMEYLKTGENYWVDTTKEHTFVNCSLEDRIHLVAVTKSIMG